MSTMWIIRYANGWRSVVTYPYREAAENMQQEHEYRYGEACWVERLEPRWGY